MLVSADRPLNTSACKEVIGFEARDLHQHMCEKLTFMHKNSFLLLLLERIKRITIKFRAEVCFINEPSEMSIPACQVYLL